MGLQRKFWTLEELKLEMKSPQVVRIWEKEIILIRLNIFWGGNCNRCSWNWSSLNRDQSFDYEKHQEKEFKARKCVGLFDILPARRNRFLTKISIMCFACVCFLGASFFSSFISLLMPVRVWLWVEKCFGSSVTSTFLPSFMIKG